MTGISYLQTLLDKEANMANSNQDNDFRKIIHIEIKQLRDSESPTCWGQDDCSTNILMRCPWRIDCGN